MSLFDEIEVLRSIYDKEIEIDINDKTSHHFIIYRDQQQRFQVEFTLSPSYPDETPKVEVISHLMSNSKKKGCEDKVKSIALDNVGGPMLFSLVESVREELQEFSVELIDDEGNEVINDSENYHDHNVVEEDEFEDYIDPGHLTVIHGEVTSEQKSSFQSHLAAVSSMEDVRLFKSIVLSNKKIRRATHNIFAYRFTCPRTGIVYHDNDDDGEAAAGGRLAEMMRLMKVDNVAVIVSRWFGGILLGPDRFKYICNSARYLLEAEGFSNRIAGQKNNKIANISGGNKKR